MTTRFQFDPVQLESLVGGLSALDVPRLTVQNQEQAQQFIKAYGFDIHNENDQKRMWGYHRRAVTYIKEELLDEPNKFPEILADPNQLKNLEYLLIYASALDAGQNSLQRWSCALLKVMHVLAHLDNDLFTIYSTEIQEQTLKPIQDHVYIDPVGRITLGASSDADFIDLKKFEVKSFKNSTSSITKLLAKRELVAFSILDKVGVRFVTKHLFDSFRVMRFLVDKNIVSFPHNIPDQSNNTLYPANIFLEVMESVAKSPQTTAEEVDKILNTRLEEGRGRAVYREKPNVFSGQEYRFIKFITRRLIRVKDFSFFYPFEVQILDYNTFVSNLTGPSSHEEYKKRQRRKARARIFGFKSEDEMPYA